MDKTKKFTEEFAKNEPPVAVDGLLAEIVPLLEDYFVGAISFVGKAIIYCLPNGQKFILKAEAA